VQQRALQEYAETIPQASSATLWVNQLENHDSPSKSCDKCGGDFFRNTEADMQKWEYAKLNVEFEHAVIQLSYITVDGMRTETPPSSRSVVPQKTRFGTTPSQVALTENDRWDWFYFKIADLGQNGWEMINAPDSRVWGSTAWTTQWIVWFKRPIP
jgi:hypothetical protein